jgi:rSAM/selenodomain-associated transferase 2
LKISVIIPTYNEAENIGQLIKSLLRFGGKNLLEIIVSDSPQSRDNIAQIVEKNGAIFLKSPQKGRAFQMNFAAKLAKGDTLYFVHADTQIHQDYSQDIENALSQGYDFGCYRYKFDSNQFLLKINAFFTRFDKIWCRGGDQTLFISRQIFEKIGGFREDFLIMEDYEIILRAKEKYRFKIIPKNVIVSARKYQTNSYLRVQLANLKVMRMFLCGNHSQEKMAETYQKMLNYR